MAVEFDYSDAISSSNSSTDVSVETINTSSYQVDHTRDFYRGHSFRYCKKWQNGVHYINDNYITDFVIVDNIMFACEKSHLSSEANRPALDGDSEYWSIALVSGNDGFLPSTGGEMHGNIDMLNNKIVNIADPSNNKDASNKGYVDSAIDNKFILLSETEFDELVEKDSTKIYLVYADDSV